MKIGKHTLDVLKNFAAINSSILLRPGKVQRTLSPRNNVMASAELDFDLKYELGIYDLSQFISTVSLLDDPDMEVNEKTIVLKDKDATTTFYGCAPKLITAPPEQDIKLDSYDAEFDIDQKLFTKIVNLAMVNNLVNLEIYRESNKLNLRVKDKKSDTSNLIDVTLCEDAGSNFSISVGVEYLKFLPLNYHVKLSTKGFIQFVNEEHKLNYFVALDS